MDNAILNSELIAIQAGNIIVYNYDGGNREYISASTEYLAVIRWYSGTFLFDAPVHIKQVMRFSVQRI
ncbi:tail fiber protein [Escherichia phage vB_EcoM-673R5]|nr:tail fiber protein [Escherichia phage vB_EcoM-673R5]